MPLPAHRASALPGKRVLWTAGIVLLCLAIVALVFLLSPSSTADGLRVSAVPAQSGEDPVVLPPDEPLHSKQEVLALKQTEVALARRLLEEYPEHEQALVIMANVFHRQGNAIESLKFRERALAVNPDRADLYTGLAWYSMKKGRFEEAVTQYRQTLALDPGLPNVHSNMADALMKLGRHEEAVGVIHQALRLAPKSSFAHYLMGQALLQLEDYEKAVDHYREAIKIEPTYASAHYGLATVCGRMSQKTEAAQHMDRFRALAAESRRDFQNRKRAFDDFRDMQKNAAITHINVGRMYRNQGQPEKAERLFKQAAGLDPQNVTCFLELASLYEERKQAARSLQMRRRVRDLQPSSASSYLMIGILSAHLGHMDDAEEAFRAMVTLAPAKPEGYRELARLYLKLGKDLAQARRLSEKAVSLEASAANYFVLGWACDATGDSAMALPALRQAVALDPDNEQYVRRLHSVQGKR
ncbi:MAG: tetratricopeptide repeat protein [Planctomycetes bacterium]|nr:tetratricopeptide repeat protein [Planctomycetota bacterium]